MPRCFCQRTNVEIFSYSSHNAEWFALGEGDLWRNGRDRHLAQLGELRGGDVLTNSLERLGVVVSYPFDIRLLLAEGTLSSEPLGYLLGHDDERREGDDFEQKPPYALGARHVGRRCEALLDERLPDTTVCFPHWLQEVGLDDRLKQKVTKGSRLCIDLTLAIHV